MSIDFLLPLIKTALAEDVGSGDVTSQLLIPADRTASLQFVAREDMVIGGSEVPALVYTQLDESIIACALVKDGDFITKGTIIAEVGGQARALLTGERVALNIMQRMSGVATLTRQYVQAIKGTKAVILDTRKTMPGMRLADKYAVRIGGGQNHRMRLDDMVLIKDNHLGMMIQDSGSRIQDIVENTRKQLKARNLKPETRIPVVVECDTMAQVEEAIAAKPDHILLDNMSLDDLRAAVKMAAGKIPLEASGGISLHNVRNVAETGVDFISVGAITHSARAVDIGLDITVQ